MLLGGLGLFRLGGAAKLLRYNFAGVHWFCQWVVQLCWVVQNFFEISGGSLRGGLAGLVTQETVTLSAPRFLWKS